MSQLAARMRELRVKDYMTSHVQTLRPDDRLLDAELLIRRAGVRHIPVLEDGKLMGVLTERDVRRYAPSILDSTPDEYNRIFEQTMVGTVMTRDVVTIAPDEPLAEAAMQLHSQHRGCLPVMEGDKLIGIITRRDLLRLVSELLAPPEDTEAQQE
jgi:acetoin utilization protein AcuB